MKRNLRARLLVVLLGAICLLATACDSNNGHDSTTTPSTVSSRDHGTDHDHSTTNTTETENGHDHHTLMEVDYEPVPTIELKTHLDPKSGINLEVITTGFELAPERASTEPTNGEGHFHIYVDGVKLRRLYAHWAHVDLKTPGEYEIRVELSANNHSPLAVNGKRLDATAMVTIPDTGNSTDQTQTGEGTTIEVEVAGGKPVSGVKRHRIEVGSTVTITVNGDTNDELHIHGYDLEVGFSPNQPGSITFEADIPGIFEAETHHHGDPVMELEVR